MRRLLLLVTLVAALAAPASMLGASGEPNEGGGGGGSQVCTYGTWIPAQSFQAVCGYNNWRSLYHSTAYVPYCYVQVWLYPNGPSDWRCSDVSNLYIVAGGGYNNVTVYNLTYQAIYAYGVANT